MQSAEAATPGADVRDAGQLEQPLHGAVLAEGAVQHGKTTSTPAERRRRPRRRRARAASSGERSRPTPPPRRRAPSARRGRSRSADHVVALRVERLDHRARRGQRDLVLARAAAGEHGDAQRRSRRRRGRRRRGRGRRRGRVVVVAACRKRPTRDRHRRARLGLRAAERVSGSSTIPSCAGSFVAPVTTCDLEAGACERVAVAAVSSRLVTSGTGVVDGPFDTVSVTVEPGGAAMPPAGSCAITVPVGWFESTSLRATSKPCAWSSARRLVERLADHARAR